MYPNPRVFFKLFFTLTILIYVYQNCSQTSAVQFNGDYKSLASSASSGAGGFDGKPAPGHYSRKFPNYSCAKSNDVGVQGLLNVSWLIKINNDSCRSTDYIFQTIDRIVEYESYNPDFLGIGSAAYERNETVFTDEPPVTDMWCRYKSDTLGFDVVVKSSQDLKKSAVKIYLGSRSRSGGQWNSQKVNAFSVSRQESGSQVNFAGDGLELEVQKSANSASLLTGQVIARVDGTLHSLQMNCRSANPAPIEEMGIGLTPMFPLNVFTTDSQEGACSHPSVLACENMESRAATVSPVPSQTAKFKLNYFAFSSPNSANILTSGGSVDGSNSLEWFFSQDNVGAGIGDFNFSAQPEVFSRFYMKFSPGFVFSPASTSVAMIEGPQNNMMLQFDPNGIPVLSSNGGTLYKGNQSLSNIDQWHCVEMRVGPGEMNLWIDSVNQINVSGLNIQGTFNTFRQWTNWACNGYGPIDTNTNRCQNSGDPQNHHPAQSIYVDNYVVSKQRIGCF